MEFNTVIRGGLVTTAESSVLADVGITDGTIAAVGQQLPPAAEEIDASGLLVVPGAIDVHTHFGLFDRNIGQSNADDYESGTRSAAAGGITTILNFAFQAKGEPLSRAVELEVEKARDKVHIDYGLHLAITSVADPSVFDEIRELVDAGFSSLKIFTTLDAVKLSDRDSVRLLQEASKMGIMVNVHAEDDGLVHCMTETFLSQGRTSVEQFPLSRPAQAEAVATSRIAKYAHEVGCPVYFVHLSSSSAMDAVREVRREGGEIYVETRPLYLFLDDSKYDLPNGEGAKFVCYPPLRSRADQDDLWTALGNGEIQTYATDHGPWNSAEKLDDSLSFDKIPAGVSNVETSIGMLYSEGVVRNRISLSRFVEVTATNPAKLFGMYPQKGTIAAGADADLVLIDPALRKRVGERPQESAADYEPFYGYESVGWPVLTMSRGEVIFRDGKITSRPGRGRLLARSRYMRP